MRRLGLPADPHIVLHLVGRDFRIRYSRSSLGWLWSLTLPLGRLLILGFVFTRVIELDIDNYLAHLFVGLVAWQWFAGGLMSATTSVVDNRALLVRPGFDRSNLPVVAVLTSGIDVVAGLLILLVYVAATIGVSLAALALPGLLVLLFLFTTGIGLMASVANVYLRDTRLMVDLVLQLGFYLTPIFYRPSVVPERFRPILEANPMAQVIEAMREVLVEGRLPGTTNLVLLAALSVTTFAVGTIVFSRASASLLDEA